MNQNNVNAHGNDGTINNQVVNDSLIQSTQMINQVNNMKQYDTDNISIDNNKNNMVNKKKPLKIILVIVLLLVITFVLFLIVSEFNKNKISDDSNNVNNEIVLQNKLWQDYQNGILTTDEYVRYMLYSEYDRTLLNEEYELFNSSDFAYSEYLVNKYYDELSNKTLKYYYNKVNLENVTFKLDEENEKSSGTNELAISNLFVDEVYAAEKVTNLNKVVLSKNKNFVIWYTTTGSSAVDYETAKKIADGLEDTIMKYESLFGYKYNFKSTVFSKMGKYNDQKKVLEAAGIDSKHLESAMQVYLLECSDSFLAQYVGRSGALRKLLNVFGDQNGAIMSPYILIKPSSFSDYERLEQLYNHEMFHHFQYEVLCGSTDCQVGNDPYILESTANLASALVTNKTTNQGFLNEFASFASAYSDKLLSEEMISKYGKEYLGYSLFVYLYNYANIVPDGVNKVVNSIYEDNALSYLESNGAKYLNDIQQNIALMNINNNYDNKNINRANVNFYDNNGIMILGFPIKASISHWDYNNKKNNVYTNKEMNPLEHNYYAIFDNSDYAYEIALEPKDNLIAITIIKVVDGVASIVDYGKGSNEKYVFDTNDYGEYEYLYIDVFNGYLSPVSDNGYVLKINEIDKVKSQGVGDYISILGCGYNDEVEQGIETYYFDGNKVIRYIMTITWYDEEEAKWNYEAELNNSNMKNVKIDGRVVTSEYTEAAMEEYWSNLTKENIFSLYEGECGVNIVDFTPDIN